MNGKNTKRGCLFVITLIIGMTPLLTICGLILLWPSPNTTPESLIVIDHDNDFIAKRAKEFDLSTVILHYEPVITAIEMYYKDQGSYPSDLEVLVPKYLSKVPGIYIDNGEKLTYKPEPMTDRATVTPFTFNIYGHYSGLASMHGWFLYYCPIEYESCNDPGDRHISQFRINDRWVWINSSAL